MVNMKNIGLLGAMVALIGFSLLMAPGCRTCPPVQEKVVTKDSLVERTVEKVVYQPVTIPGDTVKLRFSVPCDEATKKPKDGQYTLNGKRSSATVDIKDGVIDATLICNELRDSLAYVKSENTRLSKSLGVKETIVTNTKEVYLPVVPRWAWWCLGISVAWALVLIAKFFFKSYIPKPILKLLQWIS